MVFELKKIRFLKCEGSVLGDSGFGFFNMFVLWFLLYFVCFDSFGGFLKYVNDNFFESYIFCKDVNVYILNFYV